MLCAAWLLFSTSCQNGESDPKVPQIFGDTLLIDVSGQQYIIKRFGNTLWMMENFRSTQDTRTIYVYDAIFPLEESKISYYGYLYNYQTAAELQPQGWKLPGEVDLDELLYQIGITREMAGTFLKGDGDWTIKSDSTLMNFAPAGLGRAITHERVGYGNECYFILSDNSDKTVKAAKMADESQELTVGNHSKTDEYMTVRYIMHSPAN